METIHPEAGGLAERAGPSGALGPVRAVRRAAELARTAAAIADVLEGTVHLLGAATGASRAFVLELHRSDGHQVRVRASWPFDEPDAIGAAAGRWLAPIGAGHEARFQGDAPLAQVLLVPILVEEEPWGALGLADVDPAREWSAGERDVVHACADQIALRLAAARTEPERQRLLAEAQALAGCAIRDASERQAVLSAIACGVWVFDDQGTAGFANAAAARVLRVPSRETLLRPIAAYAELVTVSTLEGKPLATEELPPMRALQGETSHEVPLQLDLTSGQRRMVRASASPVRDARGRISGAVMVVTDATEELRFQQMQDQFVRVAAHELKTPVAIMKGFAQLLQRSGSGADANGRRLEAIVRGADRIDRIVQDLLEVSLLTAGKLSIQRGPVDVDVLLRELVRTHQARTSAHTLALDGDPVRVEGDRDRLAYVFDRILDNAVRYAPAGGPVQVAIASGPASITVAVQDPGIGIPRPSQERIFEPFFRAHADTAHDYGGMGVGLYISRMIVRLHGGEITFRSEPGAGSRFVVELPRGRA